ncbi:MAG: hypothetical protein ABSH25_19465, partial [Syntrophorhabdales bacterium]
MRSDAGQDLLDAKGLANVVNPPCFKAADLVLFLFAAADEDDGNGGRPLVRLKTPAHFDPVEVG